jgi:hypothetical protein
MTRQDNKKDKARLGKARQDEGKPKTRQRKDKKKTTEREA